MRHLLRAPLCLGRDRLRRPGLPTRLLRPQQRREGALGSPRGAGGPRGRGQRRGTAMKLHVHLSSNWVLDTEMREYQPSEEVDFCIIGTGAGGGVLAQRLSAYGFSV